MPAKKPRSRKARKPTALELELRLSIRLAKLAKRIAALEHDLAKLSSGTEPLMFTGHGLSVKGGTPPYRWNISPNGWATVTDSSSFKNGESPRTRSGTPP